MGVYEDAIAEDTWIDEEAQYCDDVVDVEANNI